MSDRPGLEERLQEYTGLVVRWAPRLDLVAPDDLPRFRQRHIDDCLRLLPLLDEAGPGPAVDAGSGAGLPGLVLALAEPGRAWRLLEPRSKRAAFLEEAVRALDLPQVEVDVRTAQQAAADPLLQRAHIVAVARALAPPAQSLGLLRPLVSPGGSAVVFLGKSARLPPGAEEWRPGIARGTVGTERP